VSCVTAPIGAWQRDWIRRHAGAADASVTVRYVQTASVFGDLRVPADRLGAERATSFTELTDEQLAALARQDGFAGVTTVDGTSATWHHEIDFRPTSDEVDVGRVEPTGPGHMFEHALDGSYVESWTRLDAGAGGSLAVRVERAGRVDQILAITGGHFVYARARPIGLPRGDSLAELIARTTPSRDTIIRYLDCEVSYGITAAWRIERSTLPWREGQRLAFADQLTLDADGSPAARAAAPGERWSFPVVGVPPDQLRGLFAGAR